MTWPVLKWLSVERLVAGAGGDPWAIDESLQVGRPGQIDFLAQAFHSAGDSTGEAETTFQTAQRHFRQYHRDNGEQPINNGAEVKRVKEKLNANKTQLANIAADLETIAGNLIDAQTHSASIITHLNEVLAWQDDRIEWIVEHWEQLIAAEEDPVKQVREIRDEAVQDTVESLSQVEQVRNDYSAKLQHSLITLRTDDGYDANVIDAYDADDTPDGPAVSREELSDPLHDPQQFHEFWDRLTPEQKDWLYEHNHFIGNQDGMPFVDRDYFNRMHLDELIRDNQTEVDRLRAEHPDWAAGRAPNLGFGSTEYDQWKKQWDAANRIHDGYAAVKEDIDSSTDGLPRFLAVIDDKGHAAVSINNPDLAKRNATFVPGTGQDPTKFRDSAVRAERMYWATRNADGTLGGGDVSITTWMGYDPPMNIATEAPNPSYAFNGATALDNFQAGSRASHVDAVTGGPSVNTVIGHSFGSTEVGAAAVNGHHLDADNVVAVGSPGMIAGSAGDLDLNPGAHVFATKAANDPIPHFGGFTLGPDPANPNFGTTRFEASDGPVWPPWRIPAHSSYWDLDNPALANMGRIIAGRTDVTPP